MKLFVALIFAALALITAAAVADPSSAKIHAAKAVLRCPVTGAAIDSPKDAFNSETYKGKTYYFCCSDCKPMFDKNPQRYVKQAAAWAKHPPATTSM